MPLECLGFNFSAHFSSFHTSLHVLRLFDAVKLLRKTFCFEESLSTVAFCIPSKISKCLVSHSSGHSQWPGPKLAFV